MQRYNLIHLQADEGKYLTEGTKFVKSVDLSSEEDVANWTEVESEVVARQTAKITPRLFILGMMSKGITREQIETLINSNDQVWAELNYATVILRSNPLLDQLCGQFGLTPEDVDELFGL